MHGEVEFRDIDGGKASKSLNGKTVIWGNIRILKEVPWSDEGLGHFLFNIL